MVLAALWDVNDTEVVLANNAASGLGKPIGPFVASLLQGPPPGWPASGRRVAGWAWGDARGITRPRCCSA